MNLFKHFNLFFIIDFFRTQKIFCSFCPTHLVKSKIKKLAIDSASIGLIMTVTCTISNSPGFQSNKRIRKFCKFYDFFFVLMKSILEIIKIYEMIFVCQSISGTGFNKIFLNEILIYFII